MDEYEIGVITTTPLGDTSYLLVSGDEAALVDPQRDCWGLLESCESRGVRIRYVLETHVHNDYVSGALEVRASTGATVAGPARAAYAFDHLPLAEDDEIAVGDVLVRAMETPGHTAEHTSYLVFGDSQLAPKAVFTGGSLLVGSSGRTDLSGADRTEGLARAQYRSLRRLALLPDGTRVLPTHGAGSSCAAGPASADRTTTVGAQRHTNPALAAADEEQFISERLVGLPPYPAYYRHMAPLNRAGPRVLGGPPGIRPLTPDAVARLVEYGALVVDARDRRSFAEAHLPGSLCNELDDGFATLLGQVVPFGTALVLVLPEPVAEAAAEAVTQLLRIGYEDIGGYLDGGIARWLDSGRALGSFRAAGVSDLVLSDPRPRVLDVRFRTEPGTVPGALAIPIDELPGRLAEIPRDREVWTVCGRGRRASLAASLLDRAGIPVTAVVSGGARDLMTEVTERDLMTEMTEGREL
ncbi:MBL fold metallo-hydrolase [Kitasatospora atroaurantiaca]|uniref:Glyoxylase-like metal-dependent hydrolase (Beta-lactamase superfamily II) n=1 Tax=Kitasatospora atroaurantiaca TaxID=285545 RepID=A0A561EJC0_9ACTN|nr:MBL fold metallo-hydrolase [Kitasatospora atroaurantiaca]TWE15708.1 glyoxylase-like metal-dependent hydrolase (beta-lactamase superfamily II) [Kitasatospora atroaurantiaca]